MKNMIDKQRSLYLDMAKGIAVCLVIFGHCIQFGSGAAFCKGENYFEDFLFRVIYSFHMPVFMMMSGYLFSGSVERHSFEQLVKSRIKHLLAPIAIWSTVIYLIEMFQDGFSNFSIRGIVHNSLFSLWFLWSIFYSTMVVLIVRKFFRDNMLLYLLGWLLTFVMPDTYNLKLYKFMYPYFIVFYLIGRERIKNYYRISIKKSIIMAAAAFGISLALFPFFHYDAYIYTSDYCILGSEAPMKVLGMDIYRMMIGFSGGVCFLCTLYVLYSRYKTKSALGKGFVLIGQRAMGMYIVSGYLFEKIVPRVTAGLSPGYLWNVLETLMVLCISLACTEILMRIPYLNKVLLG